MMTTDPKLESYIRRCLTKGEKDEEIINRLASKGWSKKDVKDVIVTLEIKEIKKEKVHESQKVQTTEQITDSETKRDLQTTRCKKCGIRIEADMAFCHNCGKLIEKARKSPTIVTVSARRIIKPQVCACCLEKAETSFVATYTRLKGKRKIRVDISRSEAFPLCITCASHIQRFKLRFFPIVIGIISFFIIWGIASAYSNWLWIILFPNITLNLLWYQKIMFGVHKSMKRGCVYEGNPVRYIRIYGSEHTFVFMNPKYADMLIDLNREKVVW